MTNSPQVEPDRGSQLLDFRRQTLLQTVDWCCHHLNQMKLAFLGLLVPDMS